MPGSPTVDDAARALVEVEIPEAVCMRRLDAADFPGRAAMDGPGEETRRGSTDEARAAGRTGDRMTVLWSIGGDVTMWLTPAAIAAWTSKHGKGSSGPGWNTFQCSGG
ncbi:MAG: hypothetical protein ACI8S6_000061 [Myxococcota bacterium]|jgi:hypothetical protein